MEDFVFHNPTKIVFGEEAELKIVAEIVAAGYKKVMIVYGMGHIKESGLFDKVVRRIIKNELSFTEFGGVKPNPVLSHVKDGVEWARKNNADCLLAIGGGSVIDEAKAIAAGVFYDGDAWDFFEKRAEPTSALALFCILTIGATGSEMNNGCVITNDEWQKKYAFASPLLFPKVSALNPALNISVSKKQSAMAAVDAMSHIMEVYFTKKNESPLGDRLSFALLKSIVKDTESIIKDPNDYEARASFMWSASLALNGLLPCGAKEYSFPNHLLEHSLSALYNLPHGEGLAIIMPSWLSWLRQKEPKRVDKFCKKLFSKSGVEGVAAFEAWLKGIGVATRLEDVGIDADEIPVIVSNILIAAERSKAYKEYDKKTLEEILKKALKN